MERSDVSRSQVLALAGVGLAATLLPTKARAQAATIRIGQNATDTFGEGYYAADNGAFEAAGLKVTVSTFANGAAQAEACAGGAIDVGLGEATELANGISHGLPFAIFAGGSLYNSTAPTTFLCVGSDSPARVAKDLEGRIVAVPSLVSLSSMSVKAWLVQSGADVAKVHFVEMPQSVMASAIVRGSIAAAHIGEPSLSGTGSTLRRIATPYDAIAKQFQISDWFATRDWLKANAATVKVLTGVIYQTARWANGHTDESAVILAKYSKMDVDGVRRMTRTRYATGLDPRLIQPVLDTAFAYGGLPRALRATDMIVREK
jgi:NitT/TauT family transport system substrate-binding protein